MKKHDIRLAPMAGITDIHYRNLVRKLGFTGQVYTEMIASLGIYYNNQKTLDMLRITEEELPCNLQIFGHNPETMAIASKKAVEYIKNTCGSVVSGNIGININMGCPAKKILKNHDGGYLLKDLDNAYKVYEAVRDSVKNKVSIKTRLGYDKEIIDEFLNKFDCEIIIHGRLVTDEYRGKARLDDLPGLPNIIYNGDIKTKEQVEKYKRVMIGRAVFGQPELMAGIERTVGADGNPPAGRWQSSPTKLDILSIQLDLLDKFYESEKVKLNLAKKHFLWTLKEKRLDIVNAKSLNDLRKLIH